MTKRNTIIAVCTTIILVIGGIVGYMYYKRTPTYTFKLIQQSVEKHDWDTFSKHVDTENIIGMGYDALIEGAVESDEGMHSSTKSMVSGFAKLLKPSIVAAMNENIKEWVKTGSAASSKDCNGSKDEQQAKQAADNIKRDTGFDSSNFKGVAYTKNEGDFTIVGVTFADKQLGRDFTLDIKMRQLEDGTWQALEISNLKEYIVEYNRAKQAKLDELNQPIQADIDGKATIANVKAHIAHDDPWGLSDSLQVQAAITFNSDTPITQIEGNIYLKHADGKQTKFPFTLKLNAPMSSGSKNYMIKKNLNPFIPEEAQVAKAGLNGTAITVQAAKLTYQDGTTLALKTSLTDE